MTDMKRTGRMVGVMLLVQFALLMVGFTLLDALRSTEYLGTAAGDATRIKAGVLVLLANCALTIGISITAWRVIREHSHSTAIWLIVLSVILFMLQAVDAVQIMSMVALSERYLATGGSADIYDAVAASARMSRRFAHYLTLLAIDAWLLTFYFALFRFWLVPRLLAGFAIVVVLIQMFAVPIPGFLGFGIYSSLAPAMALGMVAVAGMLTWRGFKTA